VYKLTVPLIPRIWQKKREYTAVGVAPEDIQAAIESCYKFGAFALAVRR
jgi:hypothetical protein